MHQRTVVPDRSKTYQLTAETPEFLYHPGGDEAR